MATRTTDAPAVFASNAQTVIPVDPVTGQSYRDETLSSAEIESGHAYNTIANSAKLANQFYYLLTQFTKEIEKFGIIGWSASTEYQIDSFVVASDSKLYQSLTVNTDIDPISDGGTNWTPLTSLINVSGAITNTAGAIGIKNATESQKGASQLATTAQAQAGTNDTNVMTPLKTAQAIADTPVTAPIAPAIGGIMMAQQLAGFGLATFGDTRPGNALRPSSAAAEAGSGDRPASETWKCVGVASSGSNTSFSVTCWQRIA